MKDNIKDAPIEFFDTNFWIGENNLSEKYTSDDESVMRVIAQRAEKYNITAALVTHFNSLFCSPETGNDMLACFLKKENDFRNNGPAKKSLKDAEYAIA